MNFVKKPSKGVDKSSFVKDCRFCGQTHEKERSKCPAFFSAPVLKYFDSNKPTEGSGDASSQGLGFVLTQEDHPVTYASRALTLAEQRYSQTEKELLAQVFGHLK